MAKIAKKKVEVTYCEVTPIGRRRLDPYSSRFIAVGESYILDSNKAQVLSDLGEVEILKEEVSPPWAPKAAPAPAPKVEPVYASKEK